MAGSRVGYIVIGILVAATLPFQAEGNTDSPEGPTIGVSLYNYSHIPEAELERARRTATHIFRQAGVEIDWTDIPVAGEFEITLRQTGRGLGVSDIRLRILAEANVPAWAKKTHQVAFSLLPNNGAFGTIASIYADRIRKVAKREGSPDRPGPGLCDRPRNGTLALAEDRA